MHGTARPGYQCLQILRYADNTLEDPIALPGPGAGELSLSAGGSMVAMMSLTVCGTWSPTSMPVEPESLAAVVHTAAT